MRAAIDRTPDAAADASLQRFAFCALSMRAGNVCLCHFACCTMPTREVQAAAA
jgi:hypothetical protein